MPRFLFVSNDGFFPCCRNLARGRPDSFILSIRAVTSLASSNAWSWHDPCTLYNNGSVHRLFPLMRFSLNGSLFLAQRALRGQSVGERVIVHIYRSLPGFLSLTDCPPLFPEEWMAFLKLVLFYLKESLWAAPTSVCNVYEKLPKGKWLLKDGSIWGHGLNDKNKDWLPVLCGQLDSPQFHISHLPTSYDSVYFMLTCKIIYWSRV